MAVVADYMIESRCRAGHQSSATFQAYTRATVERVACELDERCPFMRDADGERAPCGARVAHVITDLGGVERRAFRSADTEPAMRRVVPPDLPSDNGRPIIAGED